MAKISPTARQKQHNKAIVDIVAALKPWRQPWEEVDILRAVNMEVEQLRKYASLYSSRDAIIKRRDSAKAIIKVIAELRRRLSKHLFFGGLQVGLPADDPLFGQLKLITDECEVYTGPFRINLVVRNCAAAANRLIRIFSVKKPTNGSSEAPLRKIAGKLYSLVTETAEDRDFRRACGDVLRGDRHELGAWESERRRIAQLVGKKSL